MRKKLKREQRKLSRRCKFAKDSDKKTFRQQELSKAKEKSSKKFIIKLEIKEKTL